MRNLIIEHDCSSFTIHGIFDMPPEHWEALNQQFGTLINHPGERPAEPEQPSFLKPNYPIRWHQYQQDHRAWLQDTSAWYEKLKESEKRRDDLKLKLGCDVVGTSRDELFVAWLKATGIKEVEYVEV